MSFDFTKLLTSLASGQEPDLSPLIKRKANGPPHIELTPSQTAIHDVIHGALPQPLDAPSGGEPLPQPINAPTGGTPLTDSPYTPLVPHTLADAETQQQAVADEGRSDLPTYQPQAANNPNREPTIDELRAKYMADSEVHPNKLKDSLFGALTGVNQAVNGGKGDPRTYSEIKRDRRVKPTAEKIGFIEGQQKVDQETAYNKARTGTIAEDDARLKQQQQWQHDDRLAQQQSVARNTIFKSKYFDPKNKLHAQQAIAAGLGPSELEGWDDRNPYTKTVAGTTYKYDRTDQTFKPSGLPTDESATLTDYQVKMPNGEFRTYKVAQKDAAKFATQMQVLGAQIEAAKDRQTSQHEFELKKQEIGHNLSVALQDHAAAIEAGKNARDDAQRKDAANRQEDARKRIAEYETNLKLWLDKEKP